MFKSNGDKEKVYISGKITGLDINDAKALFNGAEEMLTEQGKNAINPFKIAPFGNAGRPSWADYMRADIIELCKCDSIYMLHNWEDSKGARMELDIARKLNLNVYIQELKNKEDE